MKNDNSKFLMLAVFSIVIIFSMFLVSAATAVPVDLRTSGDFAILSKAQITDVNPSVITGDVGASPITGASILLSCSEITGTIWQVDDAYTGGFDTNTVCAISGTANSGEGKTYVDNAVLDMGTAYDEATLGQTAGTGAFLNVGAGTLGTPGTSKIFAPGVYTWGSDVTITDDITLDAQGDVNALWIFQVSGTLDISSDKQINLINGAQASNIFWAVSGVATLGTNSVFNGNILTTGTSNIALLTGATLNGRALGDGEINLQSATVTIPGELNVTLNVLPGELSIKNNATAELNEDNSSHLETTGTVGGGDEARIGINLPLGTTLNDLEEISWIANGVSGYTPHVDVFVDFDNDGVVDDALVFEYAKVDPNDCDDVANYPTGDLNTFDDKGIVDNDAYAWLSSGPPGPCEDATFDANHKSLLDWKDTNGTANVTKIEIEVDNWVLQSEANVSFVHILIAGENYFINIQETPKEEAVITPTTTTESAGTGNSGSGYCSTEWEVSEWSTCVDGVQTRTVSYPTNWCEPTTEEPISTRSCTTNNNQDTININDESTNGAPITGGVIGTGLGFGDGVKGLTVLGWIFVIALVAGIVIVSVLIIKSLSGGK